MSDELPPGWVWSTYGSLGTWVGGGTPSKAIAAYWTNGTIPWVSPKDMKAPRIGDTIDRITAEAVERSATRVVPPGSVLVVVRSGILEHSLPVAITNAHVAINQDIKALIPNAAVDAEFVQLSLKRFAPDILRECSKAGTTVANVSLERLSAFRIPLPPLAEQRRIVARIEALFDRIHRARANLRRVAAIAKRFRETVLAKAFRGDLTADWRRRFENDLNQGAPVRVSFGHRPQTDSDDAVSDELPPGWVWSTYGSLGTWVGGGTPSKAIAAYWTNGTIPWVSPKDMKAPRIGDTIDRITAEAVERSATRVVPPGSVLVVVRSGILEHSLPVAITNAHVAINQDIKALIPNAAVDAEFVQLSLKRFAPDILRECSKAGTTVANVSLERLSAFRIPLPPLAEQRELVRRVEALFAHVDSLKGDAARALALLDRLERAILARAFRGELVPQDPNDEPASVLLERIRREAPTPTRGRRRTRVRP